MNILSALKLRLLEWRLDRAVQQPVAPQQPFKILSTPKTRRYVYPPGKRIAEFDYNELHYVVFEREP